MELRNRLIYNELRINKQEITEKLREKQLEDWFCKILSAELQDIQAAMEKIEKGKFGECEISGELLPYELLALIPTLKSHKDFNHLESYCRKPLE